MTVPLPAPETPVADLVAIAALVELVPDAVLRVDRTRHVRHANAAARRLFDGGGGDEAAPALGDALMACVDAVLATGEPATSPPRLVTTPGGPRWLEVRCLPERDAGGVAAVVVIAQDVTALQQARADAGRAARPDGGQRPDARNMDAMARLAGGVAHDFNNMLAVISGYADFIGMRPDTGSAARDDVRHIKDTIARAAALTRQLLTFGRRSVSRPERLDLNVLLAAVAPSLRRVLGDRIALEVRPDPRGVPIDADPAQLDQLLTNLAANARDAMPDGGTLVLRTGRVMCALDDTDCAADVPLRECVELTVRDTGPGVPAGLHDRIFEPFFTTKAPGQGAGLGLAVVHGIVQQAGGTVHAEGAEGEGATFVVRWPVAG